MSSSTLRRRLHHGDVDGGRYDRYETSRFDSLNEPLLGYGDYDYNRHAEEGRLRNLKQRLSVPFDGTSSEHQEAFQDLLHKRDGKRSEWEYPFAVAGINVSFMLVQMLDLQSGNPSTLAGHRFLELLREDEMAFDNLFCIAFKLLDAQWLAKRASYMEFNDVLKSTRTQLEREMALEDVSTVRDLPAYNLLGR
ncbi:UNVERIFIED_CONTAM: hypothetical protein Sradi_4439700 [Sesamum radiatum]|uniref:ELMO domain-containing protein n=1 Tax=Sesamum radiatum TaxID=300843 RepID=A0AAW2NQJ4_SESRA